jgi:hypothetical protein
VKKLGKWDYESQSYKDYEVPDHWKVSLYSSDMEEIISCCQCGENLEFGDGYTSKEVHTEFGLGYMVCENCYNDERIREKSS